MYENMTFEFILNRMLDRVPGNIDKREGSVIYDTLAPAAAELVQMYVELNINLNLAFAGTSGGEYLERRTKEMGITRQLATKARRKGLFYGSGNTPINIPIGSRFSIETLNYVALGKLAEGEYIMECEISGTAGNEPSGAMLPIDYVPGLVRGELADILESGQDEETDEKLLNRYQLHVRKPSTSGNMYQYRQWAFEIPGVGDAKVFPLWDGPGTVKVVIVDANKQPANMGLVEETAEYIETVRPIGANVSVVSGTAKEVDVSATVELAAGYTLQSVTDGFTAALTDYLKSITFTTAYISYAKIGTVLLGTPGVLDYSRLTVNNDLVNVELADEEVPVSGIISLGV
ncbi:baseplate J-like protein [Oxobacter pfennigii]|uniref:Baseplate J-like protein n=1 Tax=Oxobacter pfennigii TaxID=36849 RepID=A0A0P8YFD9_9CLOT|nr:baseplate J/gp47 family protein [Oxobacter pfennigii]KPU45821.1 baseplate J-like protein [Oxobacter pfennigii]